MNDDQLLRELGRWLQDADPEPPDAHERVRQAMARTPQVRQRGRWWPLPIPGRLKSASTNSHRLTLTPAADGHPPTAIERTQTMFSATKFLIAGAIVALIGGYLLTGPLTQQPSDVPSAAGATGSPGPATELPPGVDLVTEEIEPGVVRVISDGHRAISPTGIDSRVIVRNDGRVWIVVSRGFYELGREPVVEFPGQDFMTSDDQVTVGPDGDFYKLLGWRPQSWKPAKKHELWRYDGSGWAREELEPGSARVDRLWAAPDGSLRATKGGEDFQRLDRGWVRIAETADGGQGGPAATTVGGTQPLVRSGWNLEGTCAGLDRLDGEVLDHYLTDLCVYDFASGPDGRIWVTASDDPDEDTSGDLYIIDPSVNAQSEEATAEGWSYFTWTLSEDGASAYNDGGTWRASGQTLDATDPRASGVLDTAWNATGGGPGDRGLSLWEFRFELTNEDGSWTGTGSTVASHEGGEDGPETSIEPARLQGTGAYEGLTLVMITTNRDSEQERWGMIVPSAEVPAAPDSVAAA